MSALRGVVGGVLALSLLEVLVANDQAAGNASTLFTTAAGAMRRLVDPSVPLIPDRR